MVLPLPSIEVLAEAAAGSQTRTSVVIHVLESFVVTWMKLIKVLSTVYRIVVELV